MSPRARPARKHAKDLDLVEALGAKGAFSGLGKRQLQRIASELEPIRLARGQALLSEGDEGDDLYIVVDGEVGVFVKDGRGGERHLSDLGPGSLVGETAFLAGGPRAATVRAARRAQVARLSSEGFSRLLATHPKVAADLAKEMHRRLLDRHLATDLERLLGPMDDDLRAELEPFLSLVPVSAGTTLFREGDPADAAYVVLLGRLHVVREADPQAATDVVPGEIVGGAALLEGGVRNRTVFAARDSHLVRLPQKALDTLSERHPKAMLGLTRAVVRQILQQSSGRTRRPRYAITIVPGSDGVDVRGFATRLARILARTGRTFHVGSERVDRALSRPRIAQSGPGDPGDARLTGWLHELEREHRFLVYEADPTWSAWTNRAIRQSDRVLVIADAAADPRPVKRGLRRALGDRLGPEVSLVLLHSASTEVPRDTQRWLEPVDPATVVHVRDGSDDDMARLGRMVSGRAVGLVLSGGGARGLAHLGVIRALHELGVPIDLVGGSSIGAIMATIPALETEVDEMVHTAARRFSRLRDYTVPLVSVLKGKRITKRVRAEFGDRRIEDLWRPYFCISTNLTTFGETIHRRGPLVSVLRATMALPGILPPVPIDGELHIDGGVINDFPIDVMRRLYPDAVIIGVDVTPRGGPRAKVDFGLWMSGFSAFGKGFGSKRRRPPGIGDSLMRAMIVASMRDRDRAVAAGLADLYIHLDLRGVGLLEFGAADRIAERGYESGRPQIEAWLAGAGAGVGPPRPKRRKARARR